MDRGTRHFRARNTIIMSTEMMKNMKMVIDLEADTARVGGKRVNLRTMESGMYYIMTLGDEEKCYDEKHEKGGCYNKEKHRALKYYKNHKKGEC